MKFDFATVDLPALISAISALIVLCALLWAIFSPGCKEKKREKKEASFLRGSVRLYLDVLNDKLNRILNDPASWDGPFDAVAKQNHDALEKLFLGSEPLEFEERKKLRTFVRLFKGTPTMKNKEAFDAYKKELEVLMKVFPEEKAK